MDPVYKCTVCGGILYQAEAHKGFSVDSKPAHQICASRFIKPDTGSAPPITDELLCRLDQIFYAHPKVNPLQYPDNLIAAWLKYQIKLVRGEQPQENVK